MAFELSHAVIHSFSKEANTSLVTDVVKKEVLLNSELPAVVSLVTGVVRLLGKAGNAVSYGQFGDDMRQGPFPAAFDAYTSNIADQNSFLQISHTALDELVAQAKDEPLSTGGHILVAQYTNDTTPFTVVAMIKQKGGVSLDKDYVPVEITEIDLTKVHQAARINLSRYKEVSATPPSTDEQGEDDVDMTYLCFLGQGRNNQASGYFVKALGCTKGIASSRATQNAIKAVEKYFSEAALKKYRTKARDAVVTYLQKKLTTGENASLDEICHAASSCVPAEEQENVAQLKEFLNNEQNQVPAQFSVHESTLKKRIRIKADAGNWSIQFEQQILGTTPDSIICYNKESKTLTISSLTDQLIKSIETEIQSRTSD